MIALRIALVGAAAATYGALVWQATQPSPEPTDCTQTRPTSIPGPPPPRFRVSPSCSDALAECGAGLSTCDATAAACAKSLTAQLPLPDRFDALEAHPSPEVAGRLASRLGEHGIESATPIECRASTCRLRLEGSDAAQQLEAAQAALARDLLGMSATATFADEGGPPSAFDVYLELADEQATNGADVLREVREAFDAAGGTRPCWTEHEQPGTVVVQLRISNESGLSAHYGGDLGATATGLCIATQLDAVMRDTTVPDDVTPALVEWALGFPP